MELQHWFVTVTGVVHPRWKAAFGGVSGGATAVVDLPQPEQIPAGSLIWLDTTTAQWQQVLRTVRATATDLPCVVLSANPRPEEAALALDLGARGYAHVWSSPVVFRHIAQVVTHGGYWIGADLMRHLIGVAAQIPPVEPAEDREFLLAVLSSREREVALSVAKGMTNKEVARELSITERTVKAHLAAVFEKLAVRDRLHLALKLAAATDEKLPL